MDPKQKVKDACINIAKNPIILGILAGLIVGLLGIDFPVIVDKTVNSVAQMATPLALITIGAGFEGRKALAKIRPTIAASMIKLVIQPLIFLPGRCVDGISRGADDRNSDYAGISDDAELLHYGEEHGQRWRTHRERDRDDDASGGIYPDRMDLYFEDSRIDRVKVLDVF